MHFSAFALTYGSGPTLVLTAREASGTRSIAVIGLQDIYGKIQVLWHSITDDEHLDVTPRMKLIDAVDPRGDGRANLLFEERNTTDRRFVLYVVGADNAEQVFATDPLPLHPVAQPERRLILRGAATASCPSLRPAPSPTARSPQTGAS